MFESTSALRACAGMAVRCLVAASQLALLTGVASAQARYTTRATDGSTPPELATGTPAGSYALSGFDHINPYNQSLSFSLPLLRVGGRGEAGYTISLPVERRWRIDHEINDPNIGCGEKCELFPIQHRYIPNPGFPAALRPGFGPGVMIRRPAGSHLASVPGCGSPVYEDTLTRLAFVTPDGTEYELRDELHGGQSLSSFSCTAGHPRGKVFITADGTSATFISDAEIRDVPTMIADPDQAVYTVSGLLLMRDGTRYRIDHNQVTWIRDRNGNEVRFGNVDGRYTITDSLGRRVVVDGNTLTYKGYGGADRGITVLYDSLSNRLRPANDEHAAETRKTYGELFPGLPVNNQGDAAFMATEFDTQVVAAVVLPDTRRYEFYYNSYGELARVELPTGGAFEYDHQQEPGVVHRGGDPRTGGEEFEVFRRVVARRVYAEGGRLVGVTTFGGCAGVDPGFSKSCTQVDERDPNDGHRLLARTRHYYDGHPGPGLFRAATDYAPWREGREYQTEVMAADGLTVLRRVEHEWRQRTASGVWTGAGTGPANDPHIVETVTTLVDAGLSSKTTSINPASGAVEIDRHNNQTDVWEYGYGENGRPSAHPVRHTRTDYLTINPANNIDYTETNVHIRGLARARQVYSVNPATGAETVVAKSETFYDETALDPWYGATVAGWLEPGGARGNPTRTATWLDTDGTWPEARVQYDQVGNVTKSWDALNNMSEVKYAPTYHYAYPTESLLPAPDPTGSAGSAAPLVTKTTYDLSTGVALTTENANAQTTTFKYDLLSRLARVIPPSGGSETVYDYGDEPGDLYVKTSRQLADGVWDEGVTYYDALGRAVKTRSQDARGAIFSETAYDALGRINKSSNPYREGEAKHWVETVYDDLGRVKEIISPKIVGETVAAKVTSEYSSALTGAQIGLVHIGINQAGERARSVTNALGQLIRVDEPNDAGELGPVDNPAQPTFYSYDALGNLRQVTQGQQSRYFQYDSLGRLRRVRQPEQDANPDLATNDPVTGNGQWTAKFTYNVNGNVLTSTDAKGVTITYAYDNLDRLVRRSYTPPPSADPKKVTAATPAVSLKYDGRLSPSPGDPNPSPVQFANGALTEVSNGVSTTQHTVFDHLGKVRASRQIVDGSVYPFGYQYDLSGALKEQTYPSGRVTINSFDEKGDLSSVGGGLPNQTSKVYASDFRYTAAGAVDRVKLGNGRWETVELNARNQITQIGLGTSPTDTSLWKVNYEYGRLRQDGTVDVAKNDGNVIRQTVTVPGVAHPFVQTYAYDSLNRLSGAAETNGGQQLWRQTFGYDRYGNRTGFSYTVGQTPVALDHVNHPRIDPLTNRFRAGQGYEYDHNGNLIRDAEGRSFVFDGDNKQAEIRDASGNTIATYFYDGNGRRVKKAVAAGGEVTVFVYDAAGKLAAEYSNAQVPNPATRYLTVDVLNTPRVITDGGGQVIARKDYLPFGEDLLAGRDDAQRYGRGSGVRQGFTGYERDDESRLNFAEARYYNHFHGRFTTVDPLLASGRSANPQSFNRYAYAGNNPTLRVDPNGEDWFYSEVTKLTPNGLSRVERHIAWKHGSVKLTNYIVNGYSRRVDGSEVYGLHVYDPWERRVSLISSGKVEEAQAQFETFRREAALNYLAGAAEAVSLTLSLTGALDGMEIDRNSEQYLLGKNSGIIIQGMGAATGAGVVNALTKMFGKAGATVARRALPVFNNVCFVAGTLVHTDEGLKAIEEVKAGDRVLSWDEQGRRVEYKTVVRTFARRTEQLVKVEIAGEGGPVVATPEHPFYARVHRARDGLDAAGEGGDGGEWVGAGELRPGDEVRRADGGWAQVVAIERESRAAAVYNIEVAENHNYFVGTQGVLVHNQCFIDPKKLNHTFSKHAADFGITGNWNKTNAHLFEQAIKDHVASAPQQIVGTFRGTIPVTHYFDPATDLWVAVDKSGSFVAGWKLSPAQRTHLLTSGNIQ